jgi:hypothetical protein
MNENQPSRRSFLKAGLTLSAATLVAPSAAIADVTERDDAILITQ